MYFRFMNGFLLVKRTSMYFFDVKPNLNITYPVFRSERENSLMSKVLHRDPFVDEKTRKVD